MNKYVLFIPQGGFNDCCCNINRLISYCKLNKRTLLLDMTNSEYNINFSVYFNIKKLECDIIYDSNQIKNILISLKNNNNLTVYPNNLDFNIIDLFNETNKKICFKFQHGTTVFAYKNITLDLPIEEQDENVILHSKCGGGKGFLFFKNLSLQKNIKNIINKKIKSFANNYLCIQVRNTDIKCNYIKLYNYNKNFIHSFETIYICTDDESVLKFFKSKKLNIFCFTTFPKKKSYNLHNNKDILPSQKMEDLITDIFMAINSEFILSNSRGCFIKLLRDCHKNKENLLNMLK